MTADPSDDEAPTLPGSRRDSEDATIPSQTRQGSKSEPLPTVGKLDVSPYLGKVYGGCRLEALVGRGAMGAVFKARQLKLERDVAVKIIRPEQISDPRKLKRFELEARTVGKFNSPHVVMVHDVGFDQGVHFLVMEFVQGDNLRAHVKKLPDNRLPTEAALPLLRQAVLGLEEARRLGIVHRDIKPENLMLTEQGVLKIADFGIAKPAEDDLNLTFTQELVGTPLYMSPEQCQSATDIDFRSDMYSLGATFFYLLTGTSPFRATSVYELIQTKTNLDNLCLWKARPDLDESHPLSRLIARMTAKERDDRYPTYDALLADLDRIAAAATKLGAAPTTKARSWLAVAAGLALVAGGGGTVYATSVLGKGANLNVTDEATVREALARFRARLATDGPSPALRADVEGLSTTDATRGERERLLAEVAAGATAAARLAAIPRPSKPTLPFTDLEAYWRAVDEAARTLPGEAGPELRQWLQARALTAADREGLGAAARAELIADFTRWQADLGKAVGDSDQRARLGDRLTAIAEGRARLIELLPAQRDDLERNLTDAQLAEARQRLTNPVPSNELADIGPALQEIAGELAANGPSESLLTRAQQLQPANAAQSDSRKQLLDAVGIADSCKKQANSATRPVKNPKPPFDDVENYYLELDRALAPLRRDGALPAWAAALRAELRAEPEAQQACGEACARLWAEWQERRRTGASISDLETDQRALKAAVAKALQLFPDLSAPLAERAPLATLDAAMTTVRSERKLAAWTDAMQSATVRLDAIESLADWRARALALDASAKSLREDLAALPTNDEAARALAQFTAGCARWRSASERFDLAAGRLAAGDLTACLAALPDATAAEGKADFTQLRAIVDDCRKAFATLHETLDLAAVTRALADAADKAKPMTALLPANALASVQEWQSGVKALGEAAAGMVTIPAGTARDSRERLPAFFLAAGECSRGAWRRFRGELRAAAIGDDEDKRFAAVSARLAGSGLDANGLAALLDEDRGGDDNEPVDRVTWQQAMAFCRWHGKDLPRAEEWALAAFGDGGTQRFPWGQEWSDEEDKRNPHTAFAMPVDKGGLSWRSTRDARLHHLGGNVAEWLHAAVDEPEAKIAGGRHNKVDRAEAEEAAAGRLEPWFKNDPMEGIGFRTILRPRDFPKLTWPK